MMRLGDATIQIASYCPLGSLPLCPRLEDVSSGGSAWGWGELGDCRALAAFIHAGQEVDRAAPSRDRGQGFKSTLEISPPQPVNPLEVLRVERDPVFDVVDVVERVRMGAPLPQEIFLEACTAPTRLGRGRSAQELWVRSC